MRRYLIRQAIGLLAALIVASFVVFVSVYLAPGSPEQALIGQRTVSPEYAAQIRARYHLDDPFLVQYGLWLRDAVQGDFGESIVLRQPVADRLRDALPTSLLLVVYAELLVIGFGLGAARFAASGGRWRAGITTALTSVAVAVPTFAAAIILGVVFGAELGWFPTLGIGEGFIGRLYHLTLPAIALAFTLSALLARVGTAALQQARQAPHVQTSLAQGFSTRHVFRRHVLRNAAAPIVSVIALQVPGLLAGTVVVEKAFNLDGLGSLLLTGIDGNDFPIVQAVALVMLTATIAASVAADLVYAALDPRVTIGQRL
jgi:peptide/nickel transport system permease protein